MTTPIRTPAEALEAAANELQTILDGWEVIRLYHESGSYSGEAAVKQIRALAARIHPRPDDVAGLVDRLRQVKSPHASQAVDMLEAQSATIAAIEARIAAADRLADAAKPLTYYARRDMQDPYDELSARYAAYLATKGETK